MSILQSIILGIVQGLTEFLPISSSAHLVLVPYLLGWRFPQEQIFPFDVLVQMGTLLAVILYFWKDLWAIIKAFVTGILKRKPFEDPQARMGWYLILATIPGGLFGLFLKSRVEAVFSSATATAIFLFVTAAFLYFSERFSRKDRDLTAFTWKDALWMGCWQAISIFPGVSRSGSTIAGGMTRHLDRKSAARFSFLMSIPIMLAAGLLGVLDLREVPNLGSFLPVIAAGTVTAAVVGYLAIHWLLSFVTKHSLSSFAIYCVLLGAGTLAYTAFVPAATTEAAPSQQEVIRVQISPSLDWALPTMNDCAQGFGTIALDVEERPAGQFDLSNADVAFRWGAPADSTAYLNVIASEQLVLVSSPQQPVDSLTLEELRAIYAGTRTIWPGTDTVVTYWAYAADEDIEQVFEQAIGPVTVNPLAMQAAGTDYVALGVAADYSALGFMPARAARDLKVVTVSDASESLFNQPVLALTPAEPTGNLRNWLVCVQNILTLK